MKTQNELLSLAQIEGALMAIIAVNEDILPQDLYDKFIQEYPGQDEKVVISIIRQLF